MVSTWDTENYIYAPDPNCDHGYSPCPFCDWIPKILLNQTVKED